MLGKMMVERLYAQKSFEGAVATLLHDVVALHGAEFGDVQLPLGSELVIVAQQGLGPAFLNAFKSVGCDDGSACGRALRERTTIIVEDVESDPDYDEFRSDARAAGYRSVQTTPLFTSNGELIGMVSTLFANVHRPTDIEMQTLRTYSVCAADYLKALLKGADLAAKAAEMHAALCITLGLDDPERESVLPTSQEPKESPKSGERVN